jgi:tetratricopeptide (TPR) repeat protein
MDRIRRICSRRLWLLLVVVGLSVSIFGTAYHWIRPHFDPGISEPLPMLADHPPPAAPPSLTVQGLQAAPPCAGLPQPLPVDPSAHWLQPLDFRIQNVLATAFPLSEAEMDAAANLPRSDGPALGPAATSRPAEAKPGRAPQAEQQPALVARSPAGPAALPPAGGDKADNAPAPELLEEPAVPPATDSTPVASEPAVRGPQMEAIAEDADRHSRRGFELAGRNAFFAARAEFVTALRLVADGLDTAQRMPSHQQALTAGLTALRECDEFIPRGARLDSDLPVAAIIAGHRTPILRNAQPVPVSALEALRSYFTYAQEQLAVAAGTEVAASMALHGLGKIHTALSGQKSAALVAGESKAMTFFQAALQVFPQNYMASNELGVLLARCGRHAEARLALEHSLSLYRTSSGWHNLSVVYRELNLEDRSQRAERLAQLAQREEVVKSGPARVGGAAVDWVDSQSFAQAFAASPAAQEPLPARSAQSFSGSNLPLRK